MRTLLFTVLLSFLTVAAQAALPAGLVETFRPRDGVVIKGNEGEYLLDLGTNNGVREGDLIAVLAAGEEVKHPVSGTVLGRIDHARAFLRISRIKPDFSWATPLTPAIAIRPTEPVRRFGEVPAVFIDRQSDGHPLFTELQQALPHLAWRPWGETTLSGAGLSFTLDRQSLEVRDDRGTLLGSWPIAPTTTTSGAATPPPLPAVSAGALTPLKPQFKGKAIGLAIADFDGHGTMEAAAALDNRIEIGRIDGAVWVPLARFELPGAVKALTLDAADLDADGRAEVLITAVRGHRLASQVWAYDGADYRLKARDIPWYWRVLELPGEGRVALAQAADPFGKAEYADKPFRVLWRDGAPQPGEQLADFAAPTLHGSQPFVEQQTTLWAWLTPGDELTVLDAAGHPAWQGTEIYGGGEAFIDYEAKRPRDDGRRLFIRSRLERDGDLLLTPQNQGSRALSNRRKAEKSRLVALRWNGFGLEEAWGTPLREGYLADFARADLDGDGRQEYLLLGSQSSGLFQGAQSSLFLWKK